MREREREIEMICNLIWISKRERREKEERKKRKEKKSWVRSLAIAVCRNIMYTYDMS